MKTHALFLFLFVALAGCTATDAAPPGHLVASGIASYYHEPQGLACGGRFRPRALTAAHKTLPCGTRVRVLSKSTGKHVDVTINDRGPYVRGRVIDLSQGAAEVIGMTGKGLDRVEIHALP